MSVRRRREIDEALPALRRAAARCSRRGRARDRRRGARIRSRAPRPSRSSKEERYVTFVGYGGISVRRQGVQGLHVHVGMPSGEDCWRCLEAILPVASGRARAVGELAVVRGRADRDGVEPRARSSPSCRAPARRPRSRSYAEWEAGSSGSSELGVAEDYTRIWWDVRPHPKLGTLEVRVPDQPTDVRLSAAFAALLQALCADCARGRAAAARPAARRPAGAPTTRRTAGRPHGSARARELLHPDGGSLRRRGRARRRAARARRAGRARGSAAKQLLARLDPRPVRGGPAARAPTSRARGGGGSRRAVASLSAWRRLRDDPGQWDSLRAVRHAAREDARGHRGARGARTRT